MRENIFNKILIGIIVILTACFLFSGVINRFVGEEKTTDPLIPEEKSGEEVILVIDNGVKLETFMVEFSEGITAFDLLKNKAEELNLDLEIKTYDIGVLIEAIGDEENGRDGKYWMYYVNGEMPMVASDKNKIKVGDKVEFKFEESIF